VVDGDLEHPRLPLIPGHEIVGIVEAVGAGVETVEKGLRVGIPWMASTCGVCRFCREGKENLCDQARFTGYTRNGGFAEYASADQRFALPIPERYDSTRAAPLLCAGLIGYRSLAKAGDASKIGIYGFGAAAHIVCQIAVAQGREIFAFTRPGDDAGQEFARSLGAAWAGSSTEAIPTELDAAIIFAPVGALLPAALRGVKKSGRVVCGGIHMSDIPSFPYSILWGEREVVSVANLTRQDGLDFMEIARRVAIETTVVVFPLEQANQALKQLRDGNITGAAVLTPGKREM